MSGEFELPKEIETKIKGSPKPKESRPSSNASENIDGQNSEQKQPKYSEDELSRIFDEIIFSDSYSEEVVIKGKLRVNFRTRTAGEIAEITKKLDATSANLVATLAEARSLMNLHYALTSYQGKDLSSLKQEDREKFINNLSGPVIGALINALAKFDYKVFEACRDGEENF
jgi:hypothetical protein